MVSGFGFRVLGSGFRADGFGFRVSGFGFWVSGFAFTDCEEARQLGAPQSLNPKPCIPIPKP